MNDEILKLYYDYCKDYKLVDKAFIEKIIPILVCSKKLSDYVSNFNISNEKISTIGGITGASYNAYDKKINIYIENIKHILLDRKYYDYLFNDDNIIYYYNAMYLQNILHEFEHASQIKTLDERNFELENKLLYFSLFPAYAYISKDIIERFKKRGYMEEEIDELLCYKRKLYYAFYEYDPSERLAEIRATNELFEILKDINIQNFVVFEGIMKKKQYLRGYKNFLGIITSPTTYFLNKTCSQNDLNTLDFYSNNKIVMFNKVLNTYSFENRVLYGLPLTNKEYKKLLY